MYEILYYTTDNYLGVVNANHKPAVYETEEEAWNDIASIQNMDPRPDFKLMWVRRKECKSSIIS